MIKDRVRLRAYQVDFSMHIRRSPGCLTDCFTLEQRVTVAVPHFVLDACWDGHKRVTALLPRLACKVHVGVECKRAGRPDSWFCVCSRFLMLELIKQGLGVEGDVFEHLCVGAYMGRAEATEACVVHVVFLNEVLRGVAEGVGVCWGVGVGLVAWKEFVPVEVSVDAVVDVVGKCGVFEGLRLERRGGYVG